MSTELDQYFPDGERKLFPRSAVAIAALLFILAVAVFITGVRAQQEADEISRTLWLGESSFGEFIDTGVVWLMCMLGFIILATASLITLISAYSPKE